MSRCAWRLVLHPMTAARSGCLGRVCGVFADRGVSLDEVHAAVDDGDPVVRLVFAADPRTALAIRRRLERLPDVEAVVEV